METFQGLFSWSEHIEKGHQYRSTVSSNNQVDTPISKYNNTQMICKYCKTENPEGSEWRLNCKRPDTDSSGYLPALWEESGPHDPLRRVPGKVAEEGF